MSAQSFDKEMNAAALEYIVPETPIQAARFEGFRDGADWCKDRFEKLKSAADRLEKALTISKVRFESVICNCETYRNTQASIKIADALSEYRKALEELG